MIWSSSTWSTVLPPKWHHRFCDWPHSIYSVYKSERSYWNTSQIILLPWIKSSVPFNTVRIKFSLIVANKIIYNHALLLLWSFQPHLFSVTAVLSSVFITFMLSPLKVFCRYFQVLLLHFFHTYAQMSSPQRGLSDHVV